MDFPNPDLNKIEPFSGFHFKRWEERVLFLLEMVGVAFVLTNTKPEDNQDQYKLTRSYSSQIWEKANKIF